MNMKNGYVFGALALLVLASCSSGDGVLSEPEPELTAEVVANESEPETEIDENHLFDDIPDDGKPQEIVIRSAKDQVDVTKGTGTIGRDGGNWQYENIYVLMTTSAQEALYNDDVAKGWGFASIDKDGSANYDNHGYQFDNRFWSRPKEEESLTVLDYTLDERSGRIPRYYPTDGASQFFAYYVDDAGLFNEGGNKKPIWGAASADINANSTSPLFDWMDNTSSPDKITVPFQIDGSQDLMCGYATADYDVPSTGQHLNLKNFSAKSARAGVIPQIGMEHLLTRFRFYLTGEGDTNVFGIEGKTSAVQVDAITVVSRDEGTMTVACKNWDDYPAYDDNIQWKDGTKELALKELDDTPVADDGRKPEERGKSNLRAFTPVNFKDKEAEMWDKERDICYPLPVGEALLVEPNLTKYELYLYTSQILNVDSENPTTKHEKVSLEISSKDIPVFERGRTYNVTIHVQSYQEAKISIRLKAWEAGGDVVIGGDEWN